MPAINNGNDKTKQTDASRDYNGPESIENGDYATTTGYPKGGPRYASSIQNIGIPISPAGHFKHHNEAMINREYIPSEAEDKVYLKRGVEHAIRDVNDNNLREVSTVRLGNELDGVAPSFIGAIPRPVFSGATTNINPLDSKEVDRLTAPDGLREHEIKTMMEGDITKDSTSQRLDTPTSPLAPFISLHPTTARNAILNNYNRTKLPIADAEWRKGFRHIFITRPECYIMAKNGAKITLSEQCREDEDFYSAFIRSPHLCSLLSPVYVTGSFSSEGWMSNWNYLLTNRVMSMSTSNTTLTIDENITKSIEGFTVTPAKLLESEQGSNVDLTFRDTRNLEVFDCLRLWMMYAYKCKRGILAPSYNGYAYSNGFLEGISTTGTGTSFNDSTQTLQFHPYDRALDYPATIFDIVTNESGTKILYWCKYYGVYPVSVSQSMSSDSGGAITNEMSVSASFRYQKKKEFSIHNLVEFNYNAGLCDAMGRVTQSASNSLPFLLREGYEDHPELNYLGAAGMFTGSPYIVMGTGQHDAVTDTNISIPYLRFMPTNNKQLNLNMETIKPETDTIASYR